MFKDTMGNRQKKLVFALFVVFFAFGTWAFLIEPGLLTERALRVPKWPGPALRIAFFSDLHAGSPFITEDYIQDLARRINAHAPDLVLIGGDLMINNVVGGHPIPIEKITALLRELKAPLGVYGVLGNHDWWNEGEKIRQTLEAGGVPVLDNTAKKITFGSGFSFWLVGIGDEFTQHANVKAAFEQVLSAEPKILFMHDPAALLQTKEKFFLALAGHMHGGQVFLPGFGAIITPGRAPKEWAGGWVDFEGGSLFVSKGIGTSILPVRFNALPEYVILDLRD